jgi:hypothetical protein
MNCCALPSIWRFVVLGEVGREDKKNRMLVTQSNQSVTLALHSFCCSVI